MTLKFQVCLLKWLTNTMNEFKSKYEQKIWGGRSMKIIQSWDAKICPFSLIIYIDSAFIFEIKTKQQII